MTTVRSRPSTISGTRTTPVPVKPPNGTHARTIFQNPDHDPLWRDDAECFGHPRPDIWFSDTPQDKADAVELCAECPVRRECLRWAGTTRQQFGIWAGIDLSRKNSRTFVAEWLKEGSS